MDKDKRKAINAGIKAFMKQQKLDDESGVRIGFMDEDENIGKIEKIKTGIIPLDLATGGVYKGLINVWYGPPDSGKCFVKDTKIRMHNGLTERVQNIVVGDRVMGPDSKPRTVVGLSKGQGTLFEIQQNRGITYGVNSNHIIPLYSCESKKTRLHRCEDLASKKPYFFKRNLGFLKGFDLNHKDTKIDPYILGLWLGDSTSKEPSFTLNKEDAKLMLDDINIFAKTIKCKVTIMEYKKSDCCRYTIAKTSGLRNEFKNRLRNEFKNRLRYYNILDNKHIPARYIYNDRHTRIQLLAGLLDSDGYYNKYNTYEISTKFKELELGIIELCRTLGYVVKSKKYIDSKYGLTYYRIYIVPNDNIPCRLERKRNNSSKAYYDHTKSKLSIKNIGIGKYYGFEVQGDHLFLLEDGTVTHNSTCVRDATACIQKHHEWVCAYLNQEKTMDRSYWESGGVDLESLVGGEFDTNERALDFANQVADGRIPLDMLTIDTVQALASQGELHKRGSDKVKSVADNTIALIPRVYSQFLRTYTSLSNRRLTLLLISQVRTQGIGTVYTFDGMTGGNAIKHYTVVILRIEKAGKSNWPDTGKVDGKIPANSFPVRFKVDKIKAMGRYSGTQVMGYFYKGRFDYKFNTVYIAKDLGLHDGKTFHYPKGEEIVELKYRGANDMFNKIPDKAVDYMNSLLEPAYLAKIATEEPEEVQDVTLIEESEEDTPLTA